MLLHSTTRNRSPLIFNLTLLNFWLGLRISLVYLYKISDWHILEGDLSGANPEGCWGHFAT